MEANLCNVSARIGDIWSRIVINKLEELGVEDRCDNKFMNFKFDETTRTHLITCGISVSYTESVKIPAEAVNAANCDALLDELARLLMCRIYNIPQERNYIEINGVKYIKE